MSETGNPPLTTPIRFLLWQAKRQWGIMSTSVLLGIVGMLAQAATPLILGIILDAGLEDGLTQELLRWSLLLFGIGLVQVLANAANERYYVANWLRSAYNITQLVGYKVSRSGDAVTEELPTGEVVSTVAADAHRMGEVYAILSQFLGSVAAYIAVSVIMLQASLTIGLVVALGVPAIAASMMFILKPLQARQAAQRAASGRLATLGSDTVSGLRILRGIGGENVFNARYRDQSQKVREAGVQVAHLSATLAMFQVLLGGGVVTVVLWLGARATLNGELSTGQLVAFYGYAAFLTWPLQLMTQAIHVWTRASVATKRIIKVLQVVPTISDVADPATPPPAGSALYDAASGLVLKPTSFTALVCSDPDESAALATRLGRFNDALEAETPVYLGEVALRQMRRDDIRQRIVVAEATPHIYSGTLRESLDVRGGHSDSQIMAAIQVADAQDVVDSTPDGLDGELPEKGRSLSGGQRQRLALARALLTNPEFLVLIEPTSAVDAHTEARIAARLGDYRAGKATLVVTASPLILDRVDEVQVLREGKILASAGHRELVDGSGASEEIVDYYRSIVGRTLSEEPEVMTQ